MSSEKTTPGPTRCASARMRWPPRASASPRPPWTLHGSVGPSRTTITAVAERAGVQRQTVYRHFATEEDLFAACSGHFAATAPGAGRGGLVARSRTRSSASPGRSTSSTRSTRAPRRCGPTSSATSRSSPPSARTWRGSAATSTTRPARSAEGWPAPRPRAAARGHPPRRRLPHAGARSPVDGGLCPSATAVELSLARWSAAPPRALTPAPFRQPSLEDGSSERASSATASASASASTANGPVATAATRTPSARAQAMSRGVSPMTTVRSRGHGGSDIRARAIGGSSARRAVVGAEAALAGREAVADPGARRA